MKVYILSFIKQLTRLQCKIGCLVNQVTDPKLAGKLFGFFNTNWHGYRAQKLNMQNFPLIGTNGGVAGSALLGSVLLGSQLETTYVANTFVIIFFTFIQIHYITLSKLNSTSF